jgi:hypothetical protein
MSTQPIPTFPKLALFPEFEGKPMDTIIQDLLDKVIDDNFVVDEWVEEDKDYDPDYNDFLFNVMSNDNAMKLSANRDKIEILNYIDQNFRYNKSITLEDRSKFCKLSMEIIRSH